MGKLDENGFSGMYNIAGIILNATGFLALSTLFRRLLNLTDIKIMIMLLFVLTTVLFLLLYSVYLYIRDYFVSFFTSNQMLFQNRLIFRNMHVFLLLLWTSFILGLTASCLDPDIFLSYFLTSDSYFFMNDVEVIVLSIGFFVWAVGMPKVLKGPTNWILESEGQNKINQIKDLQLVHFEEIVIVNVVISFFFTCMALVLEITRLFNLSIISYLFLVSIAVVITLLFAFVPNNQRSIIKCLWDRALAH